MKTIVLNWYGPYTFEEVLTQGDWGNGLYLITGKKPYERYSKIQYCGITKRPYKVRFKEHHKVLHVTNDQRFWLSEIEYPTRYDCQTLKIAEDLIIYAWKHDLNERNVYKLPTQPTTLINYWFKTDETRRINKLKIYKNFSDVLSWDGEYWRTGNLKVYPD